MRVLMAEDDAMIGAATRAALADASYAVDWVQDGSAVLAALSCQHYDMLLLDLGLPGKDGLDVLQAIRQAGQMVPVLIVTARDGLDDRLRGLDGGADDYIVKPFDTPELLARMRAVIRRQAANGSVLLENGIVTLDPATHEARVEGAPPVLLSNREFALLHALLLRPGTILSRGELEDRVYGWGHEVESNAVEFLIHSLRRKLGSNIIKNVRGAGWMVSRNG